MTPEDLDEVRVRIKTNGIDNALRFIYKEFRRRGFGRRDTNLMVSGMAMVCGFEVTTTLWPKDKPVPDWAL